MRITYFILFLLVSFLTKAQFSTGSFDAAINIAVGSGTTPNPSGLNSADLDQQFTYSDAIKIGAKEEQVYSFYPNPSNHSIYLEDTQLKEIEIIDMLGKVMVFSVSEGKVDISVLENGYYLIRLNQQLQKLIKN